MQENTSENKRSARYHLKEIEKNLGGAREFYDVHRRMLLPAFRKLLQSLFAPLERFEEVLRESERTSGPLGGLPVAEHTLLLLSGKSARAALESLTSQNIRKQISESKPPSLATEKIISNINALPDALHLHQKIEADSIYSGIRYFCSLAHALNVTLQRYPEESSQPNTAIPIIKRGEIVGSMLLDELILLRNPICGTNAFCEPGQTAAVCNKLVGHPLLDDAAVAQICKRIQSLKLDTVLENIIVHIQEGVVPEAFSSPARNPVVPAYQEQKRIETRIVSGRYVAHQQKKHSVEIVNRLLAQHKEAYFKNYSEPSGKLLNDAGVPCMRYAAIVNYIATYIARIFRPTFTNHIQVPLLVHAQWGAGLDRHYCTNLVNDMRDVLAELAEVDKRINEIAVGGQPLLPSIRQSPMLSPQLVHQISQKLVYVDKSVREIIEIFSSITAQLGSQLRNVIMDYKSKGGHQIITNWPYVIEKNSRFVDTLSKLAASLLEMQQLVEYLLPPESEGESGTS